MNTPGFILLSGQVFLSVTKLSAWLLIAIIFRKFLGNSHAALRLPAEDINYFNSRQEESEGLIQHD